MTYKQYPDNRNIIPYKHKDFDDEDDFNGYQPINTALSTDDNNDKKQEQLQMMVTITSGFLDIAEKVLKITANIRTIIRESELIITPDSIYSQDEIARYLKISKKDLKDMIAGKRLKALTVNENEFRILGKSVLSLFEPPLPLNEEESFEESFIDNDML